VGAVLHRFGERFIAGEGGEGDGGGGGVQPRVGGGLPGVGVLSAVPMGEPFLSAFRPGLFEALEAFRPLLLPHFPQVCGEFSFEDVFHVGEGERGGGVDVQGA